MNWTVGATKTLAKALTSGRDFAVSYKNIASTDVVHLELSYADATDSSGHIRATITPNTITFGTENNIGTCGSCISFPQPDGPAVAYDSNNKIWVGSGDILDFQGGDPNTASSLNADLGSSWTAGFSTPVSLDPSQRGLIHSSALLDIGFGNMLYVSDDVANNGQQFTQLHYSKFTSTSWSPTNPTGNVLVSAVPSQDKEGWDAIALNNSDVRVVSASGSNAYVWRKFDGTSWSAPSASIPNQTSTSSQGVFLATDGASMWMFVIDSDSASTVRYKKFDGV